MSSSKTQGSKWAGEASTNVFYFASLKEIKWKVFESPNISHTIEPNHPVILTCRRLFHANRLVTWHLGRNGLQLWLFYWPTDDLDLNSMNLLKEVQQGVWDNGLPGECLSHLYKAVHQHFERAFFKTGYARVGKYFVKADGTFQQSFQIGFFIHGGHHLCSSIELKEKLQVHFLKKSNLDNVQKLKVVLMPIGIECSLTGHWLSHMTSLETLSELEDVFPAYQVDRNDPNNCQKMFLVETEISGHTMLYPASHVLIVNDVIPPKSLEGTLKTLNDEVGGIVSTEGEVTSASTTADPRDPGNQQAVWRENGYWNYQPPPDNLKCASHAAGSRNAILESTVSITKRARAGVHKKRLQRTAYKANLERNKYRDDKSPVINLTTTLPIKTNRVPASDTPLPAAKSTDPLPRLQPVVRTDFTLPTVNLAEPFESQPLTIECVENTACRDESKHLADMIPGMSLSQRLYKLPLSSARRPLPTSSYNRPAAPIPSLRSEELKRGPAIVTPATSAQSPVKKPKLDLKVAPADDFSSTNTSGAVKVEQTLSSDFTGTNTSNTNNSHNRQNNFTHYSDIRVDQMDLDDKLFESDTSDASDDEHQTVLETNVAVVPDSVLTPDNGSDGGKGLTSPQTVAHFMTPQSHDYPTPPSNDPSNNYHAEELLPTEDRSVTCEKKRDTYHQLLFDNTSYAALPLKKYLGPIPASYHRDNAPAPRTSQPVMLNSPLKTPPQSCLENLDITAKLESFSTELKESGLLSGSPDLSRTMHMSASKEEMTLLSIGEKIMQSPDHKFAFPSAFAQTNIKRELSDLPKLQGGQFLIKFGDSYLNKFIVSSEDVILPGGYSCLQNDNKSVLLDTSRMEIYANNEHKSTVGYLPKSSISIALYQSHDNKVVTPQNPTPFSAVRNSRFSPSFLKILQQGVRNVVNFEAKPEEPTFEETMATNSAIDKVGKLLESRLPADLVLQKPRTCILPWKSFSSLAEKYNTGTGEQPQPALLLGHEQQWMSVSPQSVPVWISKGMEPFSGRRDVHYLVVIPDNAHIIHNIHNFFENLSTVYELSHLGHHKQLATKIREGVMRVSKKSGEKVAREPLDKWFTDKNDPESLTWQMYAKTCQHLLAKYLASFLSGQGSSEHRNIVIYFIDPFKTRDLHTKAQLVTRCFNSMQEELNKTRNTHFIMQSIPADYVSGNHMNLVQLTSTLKSVCFSVYNQTLKHVKSKALTTCLTGFGPVSHDVVLEGGEQKMAGTGPQQHVYSPLCVLKSKPHTETVASKLDTLFCAYSLSHDSNWVIVAVSDASGHLLDTALYAVDEPSRQGVTSAVLNKIWTFCLSVIENYRSMWCLVLSKMGNVTDAEDSFWQEKFKSVVSWNAQLQERCEECKLSNKIHTFGIASISLLSFLNSAHVNILPLLNRPKPLDFRTSSQILLLSPQQPLVEPLDRFKKLQEDSFTFYSGPEQSRDKRRKILSSAYLASSAPYAELPRHMGTGKSSVLLGNLHQHIVTMSSKKHVLLSDNHPLALRYILQQLDALSWLQINPTSRTRRSPLPLHMFTVANIYSALQSMTFVPP